MPEQQYGQPYQQVDAQFQGHPYANASSPSYVPLAERNWEEQQQYAANHERHFWQDINWRQVGSGIAEFCVWAATEICTGIRDAVIWAYGAVEKALEDKQDAPPAAPKTDVDESVEFLTGVFAGALKLDFDLSPLDEANKEKNTQVIREVFDELAGRTADEMLGVLGERYMAPLRDKDMLKIAETHKEQILAIFQDTGTLNVVRGAGLMPGTGEEVNPDIRRCIDWIATKAEDVGINFHGGHLPHFATVITNGRFHELIAKSCDKALMDSLDSPESSESKQRQRDGLSALGWDLATAQQTLETAFPKETPLEQREQAAAQQHAPEYAQGQGWAARYQDEGRGHPAPGRQW